MSILGINETTAKIVIASAIALTVAPMVGLAFGNETENVTFSMTYVNGPYFEDTMSESLQQDGFIVTNYQPFENGTVLVEGVVQ